MDRQYDRLKRKLLLMAAAGALGALAATVVLWQVADCLWGQAMAQGVEMLCRGLFGMEEAAAQGVYRRLFREGWLYWVAGLAVVYLLGAFYMVLGRFTRWLDRIGGAVHQVVDETGEPVTLPRELAPLERDLRSLQSSLADGRAQAREAEQRRQDLVAFLAHDLRTPLTSVLGYLNLLRDDPGLTEEQRAKYTAIALDKANRLGELIGEFFDITKMDFAALGERRETIQLSLLLEQLSDEFYPAFAEKDLTCRCDIAQRLTVRGDADKLARVFDNVLRNAVSYSAPGGEVEIQAAERAGWAEIAIRNQGLEIPEQELTNIFQKFYRLDQARSTRTGGAGLGLAIAREIVERHGGTIRAESDGRRTSFVIRIPLAEEGEK
ncbi:cell wall metabolism sensor histidine kinase WalK [Intestinimonas sp.]|uniref:sensor histidine kinase n=1 Tax=Intestinimonas sp. TaxID=1965293 RepID=UPI002633C588|nr:HAMP domain-containing sensor histidine kinase [Intestinimonas sp.]